MDLPLLISTSIIVLTVALYMAVSSADLVRLLISLELMFVSIFIMLVPLLTMYTLTLLAFSVLVIVLFSAASELSSLITLIVYLDRHVRSVGVEQISRGRDVGERKKDMYNL